MPRITYADRFATLLAKDYLSDRDRKFTESLFQYYQRKKSLTPGRRRYVLKLEEHYAERPETDDAMDIRIRGLVTRMGENGTRWEKNFTHSLRTQVASGRTLSEKQIEILEKIESKYTDEELSKASEWASAWGETQKVEWAVLMRYYASTGYYRNLVLSWQLDQDAVPSLRDYTRITENKFARKILDGWRSDPVYAAGSMVSLRTSAKFAHRKVLTKGVGVVIKTNADEPKSACRGNKIYEVLPVGGVGTIMIEERYLKKARVK